MKSLSLCERVDGYHRAFPDWPAPQVSGHRMDGIWDMGNNYRNASRLYGAYPPTYLRRVMSLFPDACRILHLFAGSLPAGDYVRFDLHPPEDGNSRLFVQGDAHHLSQFFGARRFDLVIADPPYSQADAARYGTAMVNRRRVLHEVWQVVEPGGHLVWLDCQRPMFRKDQWHLWGTIGVVRSTNHRVRLASFFERVAQAADAHTEDARRAGQGDPCADPQPETAHLSEVSGGDAASDTEG